jgi:hypothetical protein
VVANHSVNIGLGLGAFFLTFYFSWFNNTWLTTLFRSGVGFLLFFLFGYLLRFILHIMESGNNGEEKRMERQTEVEELVNGSFESIPLASLHQNVDTEKMTETIRAWTKEDREG